VSAGDFTTVVVVAGSLLRPVGGWLSDRIGGYGLLIVLLTVVATCLMTIASLPPLPLAIVVLFLALGLLGMGNGAVFQLVPQRFSERMGLVTGIVGAAGGSADSSCHRSLALRGMSQAAIISGFSSWQVSFSPERWLYSSWARTGAGAGVLIP
jgi:nitrate/nitrite transporter NarK